MLLYFFCCHLYTFGTRRRGMARRIVITSGKGGVGKTTVCANLGYALARNGLSVLMLDLDMGLNNLDVVMGMENKIVYDVVDVVEGRCRAKQALVQDFVLPKLYLLPSIQQCCAKKIEYESIDKILNELEFMFDYILIDCPAGVDYGFVRAVSLAREAIVVTTPHISAVRDSDKVFSILNNYELTGKYLIVNRARGDLIVNGDMISVDTIVDYMKVDLLGVVPDDDIISCQLLSGGKIDPSSEAYVSFDMMANSLHGGVRKIYDCTKRYRGFVGSIRRSLRRRV